jgi:hypothetical protein
MVKNSHFVKLTASPVERTIGTQGVDLPRREPTAESRTELQRKRFLSTISKLERKVNHMEEDKDMSYEEGTAQKMRVWAQENLRIITSVFIVAVIAFGIYSYSDRGISSDDAGLKKIASSETSKEDTGAVTSEEAEKTSMSTDETKQAEAAPVETSRETETSFIEVANRGEGLTHLARRATTDYLDKNADSSLTAEHRIYIEDYLRKKAAHQGGIKTGTDVEFSKSLVKEAIDASKNLNERQLENLKKYSARVSEFRK